MQYVFSDFTHYVQLRRGKYSVLVIDKSITYSIPVSLVNYLQYPCVIMFFNGNHGSHFSSIFSFTRRCEVVYISPTVTISTGDTQDILGEKSTDSYSFMPLVFYLQRTYSFNCDRFSEVQIRIEKDIA